MPRRPLIPDPMRPAKEPVTQAVVVLEQPALQVFEKKAKAADAV